jgi:hypothetical protein
MRILIAMLALMCFCGVAVAHGGGFRRNSPPGQRSHKNHKTGEVHFHSVATGCGQKFPVAGVLGFGFRVHQTLA